MSKPPDFFDTLSRFAQRASEVQMPETEKCEALKEIAIGQTSISGSGAGLRFLLKRDQEGDYVQVKYGFQRGWHYVSDPILLRDRREELLEVALKYKDYLEAVERKELRESFESQLIEAQQALEDLDFLTPLVEPLSRYYDQLLTGINDRLENTSWTQDQREEKESLEAAKVEVEQILERLTPEYIQGAVSANNRLKTSMESQLEAHPEISVPDTGRTDPQKILEERFLGLPGTIREVKETESISGHSEIYLEISNVPSGRKIDSGGTMRFASREIKLPKIAFPPFVAGILSMENILTAGGLEPMFLMDPFGDDEIERETEEAGGIFRVIGYTSRSGRHQGRARLVILPSGLTEG